MVRPLRSTPVTGASSLLRTGPPARPASVLNTSQFLLLGALPLTAPDLRAEVSGPAFPRSMQQPQIRIASPSCRTCLLYTSDAADDLLCVDLGGRRIIKKKKRKKKKI